MNWQNKNVLITAGPTREPIDPVRYISNYSTGKMGIAIATHLAECGANVTLVLGPSTISFSEKNIKKINVESAAEMFAACAQYFSENEVIIFAAAVADYTPKNPASQKIKKNEAEFSIELVKTKDIAYEMGKMKSEHQFMVGFALETNDELANAMGKLKKKNLDMIVLNSLKDKGAGFQVETNKITIIDKTENIINFELKHKDEVAKDIVAFIENKIEK